MTVTIERGDIVLHAFPPFGSVLSASPFPIRVEMYMRWAKIPYHVTWNKPTHPHTGKTPWIEYKGKDYPDSALIIKMLSDEVGLDMDSHLSIEERSISRAYNRMLTEGLLFVGFAWRFCLSDNGKLFLNDMFKKLNVWSLGGLTSSFIISRMRKTCWSQGITRYTPDQILQMGRDDLAALSQLLGERPYIMGSQISSFDCLAFPCVSILYHACHSSDPNNNPLKEALLSHDNLERYRMRMQGEVFPDWDKILEEKLSERDWTSSGTN